MIDEKVMHTKFGEGIIEDVKDNHISVRFMDKQVRKFTYPNAFEKFLRFENENLQKAAAESASVIKLAVELERERKKTEYEIQEKELKRQHLESLKKKRKTTKKK